MEADWEFQVGGDAPVIEARWAGFIDLRVTPERARDLPECLRLPGLALALERLNSQSSPVWTLKCDWWPVSEPIDADELNAPPGRSVSLVSSYVDLLSSTDQRWSSPLIVEDICKLFCRLLKPLPLMCCRVDFVIRTALIVPDRTDLGISAYVTACGASPAGAMDSLDAALRAFAETLCRAEATIKERASSSIG
jgi:hypothetical protein